MNQISFGSVVSVLSIGVPLLLALALGVRPLRPLALRLSPWAALPALWLAIRGGAAVDTDLILLGTRIYAADSLTRQFLLLTALLWFFAGWFARAYLGADQRRHTFWVFFLATMGGNVGVVIAQDLVSFYSFYVLMTYAAWGLILYERTIAARRAGFVYLVMSLVGEAFILGALILIVRTDVNVMLQDVPRLVAGAANRDLLVGLLLAGFGVKAGAVPLHSWLPLAHPVAPTPASAVLSGCLIKAGLLGWLRFLPLGLVALPVFGWLCAVAGVLAVVHGAAVGVTQRNSKTVLAYSSISQMGFMTAALGVGLAVPAAGPLAIAAISVFALHHALAKGALFLGVTVAQAAPTGWRGWLFALGLVLPALQVAGAPFSSGALAKASLKQALVQSPWDTFPLVALLSLAAVGSTLLMLRFLSLAFADRDRNAHRLSLGIWLPWALLLIVGATLPYSSMISTAQEKTAALFQLGGVWSAAWPIVTGLLLAYAYRFAKRRGAHPLPEIPAGDILVPVATRIARFRAIDRPAWNLPTKPGLRPLLALRESSGRLESWMGQFQSIGVLFLLLLGAFLLFVLLF